MDRTRRVFVLICLLPALRAGQLDPAGEPEVTACMRVGADVQHDVIQFGQSTASRILGEIGVRLRWSCSRRPPASPAEPIPAIQIQLLGRTPDDLHKGALAFALPYAHGGTQITVFYDRFASYIANQPCSAPVIFGHVLAHELGHILCGVASHSDTGLMRATWSNDDIALMRMRDLNFQPEDGAFIRRNLARAVRRSRQLAAGAASAARPGIEKSPAAASFR